MLLKPQSSYWVLAPGPSKLWIAVPLTYTLFIQVLTGFPKPGLLRDAKVHDFFIQFSETLFDYPFWLQDLSHFPLFFIFGWLWAWYIRRIEQTGGTLLTAILISASFAIINELFQFYIPQRFPSMGDIVMNISGVISALFSHSVYLRHLKASIG